MRALLLAALLAPISSAQSFPKIRPGSFDHGPSIGSPAPAFVLPDASGKPRALAEHAGKVVVVDFWASWCGPCRRSMPYLAGLARRRADVVVLGLNFKETPEQFRPFLEALAGLGDPVTYPILLDADAAVAKAYGVRALPTAVVVGPDGLVRAVVRGDLGGSDKRLEAAIDEALGKR